MGRGGGGGGGRYREIKREREGRRIIRDLHRSRVTGYVLFCPASLLTSDPDYLQVEAVQHVFRQAVDCGDIVADFVSESEEVDSLLPSPNIVSHTMFCLVDIFCVVCHFQFGGSCAVLF